MAFQDQPTRDAFKRHPDSVPGGDFPTLHDTARALWFKRYPATQTFAAFLLATLATAALSIDPTAASYHAIMKIDPTATGALYICYEVLLSFAGHTDAMLYLALACLLALPMRYVFFGRRARPRPSVVIPSLAFAACMVFGRSYDLTDGAGLVFGGISRCIESIIAAGGWTVLAYTAFFLLFEAFDWFGAHRLRFTEARFGRLWRAADLILNRHPFAVPFAVIVVTWLPTFIGCMPGLFMGDTGAQIRQWFNYPNGTSDYLNLINPNVLLNAHHPVVHTAILGTCVQLGMSLFGSENTGLLIYTTMQFLVTAATTAYLVSSLRRFGVGLVPRGVVLAFFVFMPLFSNYAVLITKDVLFGDSVRCSWSRWRSCWFPALPFVPRRRGTRAHPLLPQSNRRSTSSFPWPRACASRLCPCWCRLACATGCCSFSLRSAARSSATAAWCFPLPRERLSWRSS